MQVARVIPDAKLPSRATEYAAGYDLYSAYNMCLRAGERTVIATGISMAIPNGHYGRVAPRSSISKQGVDVCAGVVDSDYRGQVFVMLHNTTDQDYQIQKYDRIAQMIITPIATPEVIEVDNLDITTRGSGGFGSTGR